MCFDGKCVSEVTHFDKEWRVEIDIDAIDAADVNESRIVEVISEKTGIDADDIIVVAQINDKGQAFRIDVYVDSKKDAENAEKVVNDIKDTCEKTGVYDNEALCRTKSTHVTHMKSDARELSEGNRNESFYLLTLLCTTLMLKH